MKEQITRKKNVAAIAMTSVVSAALLAGCSSRDETVATSPQVIKKTTIEKAPQEKSKTIIVQPAPKATPKTKTKTETNVTVQIKPADKPAPTPKLPEPAPAPTSNKMPPPSTPSSKPESAPKPKTEPASKTELAAKPAVKKPIEAKSSSAGLKVRAEVIATSKVPDPKNVPYKDALVFTKYKVLEIKNGEYKEKEILVAQWAMKNKKLQPAARQKVGDVQILNLQPLSKRGDLESVMRNDDTGEYDLEPYFAE